MVAPVVFGPVTAFLIATRFSPELQGIYYTFGSIVSLNAVFELGLGQVVTQFAAHERSKLTIERDGAVSGDPASLGRVESLARGAATWYRFAALAVFVGLGFGGYAFFAAAPGGSVSWRVPWLVLSAVVALRMLLLPRYALVQGSGMVAELFSFRFIEQVVNGVLLWCGLLGGLGLFALPLALGGAFLWGVIYLVFRFRGFLQALRVSGGDRSALHWWDEVWPMQWRVAVSSTSTFVAAQLLVPIAFASRGAAIAGQLGLTAALCTVLGGVASAWVITKLPALGRLVGERAYERADSMFERTLVASVVVACGGGALLLGGVWVLGDLRVSLAARILPIGPASVLVGATVVNVVITSLVSYLRAYRREPVAGIQFVSAALTVSLATALAGRWGAEGVVGAYLAVLFIVQLPLTALLFVRRRREFQQEAG